MTDTEILDFLEVNELTPKSHREKYIDGWTIWWVVYDRRGKAFSHPYGSIRDAVKPAVLKINETNKNKT